MIDEGKGHFKQILEAIDMLKTLEFSKKEIFDLMLCGTPEKGRELYEFVFFIILSDLCNYNGLVFNNRPLFIKELKDYFGYSEIYCNGFISSLESNLRRFENFIAEDPTRQEKAVKYQYLFNFIHNFCKAEIKKTKKINETSS